MLLIYFTLIETQEEREKFELLYTHYKNRMLYIAYSVLHDYHEAEDAVHNAFIAIAKHIDKIGDIDHAKTASYVLKSARNMALNAKTKKHKEGNTIDITKVEIASEETALRELCSAENYQSIVNCILTLDTIYRDVLSLHYLNEFSVKEIAALLGRKHSTVKQQLVRGKKLLVISLQKELNLDGSISEYFETGIP